MQLNHRIFKGVPEDKLNALAKALQMNISHIKKGCVLLAQGEENHNICLLLSGKAHAVRYTAEGREVDYAILQEGALYGYALAFSRTMLSPVTVFADSDCQVLSFPYAKLLFEGLFRHILCKFQASYLCCRRLLKRSQNRYKFVPRYCQCIYLGIERR